MRFKIDENLPQKSSGIIVLRVGSHAKNHILKVFHRVIPCISQETLKNCLWIVEENRIRIRSKNN